MLDIFRPLSYWFRYSASTKPYPNINLIGSGDGGHKDLAVKTNQNIYVRVPVTFTEPSVNQVVDVHTKDIICKILVC